MFRFVAVWPNDISGQRVSTFERRLRELQSAGWRNHTLGSCRVLTAPETPYVLCADRIVIGRCFNATFDQTAFVSPADFATRAWGRYVAIAAQGAKRWVLRSPGGGVPCFYAHKEGYTLIFSHLSDVVGILGALTPNRNDLTAWIAGVEGLHSTLNEVEALAPGAALQCQGAAIQVEQAWDAATVAVGTPFRSSVKAGEAIRTALEASVAFDCAGRDRLVLELSGGLDSSILAALVARMAAHVDVIGVNYSTDDDSDERVFARTVANRIGIDLHEVQWDPNDARFVEIMSGAVSARPSEHSVMSYSVRSDRELIARFGCRTFMAGQGGDHIFFAGRHPWPALGSWREYRGVAAFMGGVRDGVRLSRKSYWRVLSMILGARAGESAQVSDRAQLMLASFDYGEGDRTVSLSRAKAAHLESIEGATNPRGDIGRWEYIEMLHPLLNQPVVEACLRTPVHLLCEGGVSRALERRTFTDLIPESVRTRVSKGSSSQFTTRMLEANLGFVREALLGGELAKQGIIRCALVAQALKRLPELSGGEVILLLRALAAEGWLARLHAARQRVAA